MKRGTMVKISNPVDAEDKKVAVKNADRIAVVMEITEPHGYARIHFYGDVKDRTWLVHPESLEIFREAAT